jgi:hypothetical protein
LEETNQSRFPMSIRGPLTLVALVLGFASLTHSVATVIEKADPRTAYALAPYDGRIAAAYGWKMFSVEPDAGGGGSQQTELATQALLKDPTAVEAISVLGLQAQLRADTELADAVFGYSVSLSRRELPPQIWAIENAVERGDIAMALENYDVAMRTSQRARDLLFPILASALTQPAIRSVLIDKLADRPDWGSRFISYVPGRDEADPRAVTAFFREGASRGLSIDEAERARGVQALVSRGFIEEAWSYYRTLRPRARRDRSRDPDFTHVGIAPTPFDWTVGDAKGVSAAMVKDGDGGLFDFSVPPATRATVLNQLLLLPPGRYRLEGRSSGTDQPEKSRPYWALTCRSGRELGRVDLPSANGDEKPFSGEFIVPSSCPVQELSLVVRASDSISGVDGRIERASLVRANT